MGAIVYLKYLGKKSSGDLRFRSKPAADHRVACAWMKYKAFQHVFENKMVSIFLRLRMFDSVITSTTLFAMETVPLTDQLQNRLDVVQRTMLRRMIGWVCISEESFAERGHRMKEQMRKIQEKHSMESWSSLLNDRLHECPYWCKQTMKWHSYFNRHLNFSQPRRVVGHPLKRWDDDLG